MAEVRFGARAELNRSLSISATSALTGQPRSLAACSSALQKAGSRLIDVGCPAMRTDRFVGGA
jgi:hypothetical protein